MLDAVPGFSYLGDTAALRPIHARRMRTEKAICGDVGPSQWTNQRPYVSCPACVVEIERRDEERKGKAS